MLLETRGINIHALVLIVIIAVAAIVITIVVIMIVVEPVIRGLNPIASTGSVVNLG